MNNVNYDSFASNTNNNMNSVNHSDLHTNETKPDESVWAALRKIKEAKNTWPSTLEETTHKETLSLDQFDCLITNLSNMVKEPQASKKLEQLEEKCEEVTGVNKNVQEQTRKCSTETLENGQDNILETSPQKEFNYESWKAEIDGIFGNDEPVTVEPTAADDMYLQKLKAKIAVSTEKQSKQFKEEEKQSAKEKKAVTPKATPTMPRKQDDFVMLKLKEKERKRRKNEEKFNQKVSENTDKLKEVTIKSAKIEKISTETENELQKLKEKSQLLVQRSTAQESEFDEIFKNIDDIDKIILESEKTKKGKKGSKKQEELCAMIAKKNELHWTEEDRGKWDSNADKTSHSKVSDMLSTMKAMACQGNTDILDTIKTSISHCQKVDAENKADTLRIKEEKKRQAQEQKGEVSKSIQKKNNIQTTVNTVDMASKKGGRQHKEEDKKEEEEEERKILELEKQLELRKQEEERIIEEEEEDRMIMELERKAEKRKQEEEVFQMKMKTEEEIKKKIENEKKAEMEVAKKEAEKAETRKREMHETKNKMDIEKKKRETEERELKKKNAEEKIKQVEEEKIKKKAEEDKRKRAEETKLRKAEEAKKQKQVEELERKRAAEEKIQKVKKEKIQKKAEEDHKKNADEDKLKKIEEEKLKRAEECTLKEIEEEKAQHKTEAEKIKRADEDKLKINEEEMLQKKAYDNKKKRAEEETLKQIEEEKTQKKAEEEKIKRIKEDQLKRIEEEKEAEVKRQMAEDVKLRHIEEEQRQIKAEEERKNAEEAKLRKIEDEKIQKKAEEERIKKVKEEQLKENEKNRQETKRRDREQEELKRVEMMKSKEVEIIRSITKEKQKIEDEAEESLQQIKAIKKQFSSNFDGQDRKSIETHVSAKVKPIKVVSVSPNSFMPQRNTKEEIGVIKMGSPSQIRRAVKLEVKNEESDPSSREEVIHGARENYQITKVPTTSFEVKKPLTNSEKEKKYSITKVPTSTVVLEQMTKTYAENVVKYSETKPTDNRSRSVSKTRPPPPASKPPPPPPLFKPPPPPPLW